MKDERLAQMGGGAGGHCHRALSHHDRGGPPEPGAQRAVDGGGLVDPQDSAVVHVEPDLVARAAATDVDRAGIADRKVAEHLQLTGDDDIAVGGGEDQGQRGLDAQVTAVRPGGIPPLPVSTVLAFKSSFSAFFR